MNRQETAQTLVIMRTIWPNIAVDDATIQAWQWALGDMPMAVVEPELKRWMRTSQFPPKPAEILGLIAEGLTDLPTPGEAWLMVRARMNGAYRAEDRGYWSVPQEVKDAVEQTGGMYNLRESQNFGYDETRFLKLYAEIRDRTIKDLQVNGISPELMGRALGSGSPTELPATTPHRIYQLNSR